MKNNIYRIISKLTPTSTPDNCKSPAAEKYFSSAKACSPNPAFNDEIYTNDSLNGLKKENEKLKLENKKLLQKIVELELQHSQTILKLKKQISELEEVNLTPKLLKENDELSRQLQQKERLKEINLEKEFMTRIAEELKKTPGVYCELRTYDGRKSEVYTINKAKTQLSEVIIPNVVFKENDFVVETRKLTEEEIAIIEDGEEVVHLNQGSKLTSLSAYDVVIRLATENDKKKAEKAASILGKKKQQIETQQSKRRNKQQEEVEQKVVKQQDVSKTEEKKQIEQMKQPDVELNGTVPISLKEVYFGNPNHVIEINGIKYTIAIPIGVNDGTKIQYTLATAPTGQKLILNATLAYDPKQFSNSRREGNNLVSFLSYSKQYAGVYTKLPLFDDQTETIVQLVDGTFKLDKCGFTDSNGNKGDYYFTIKLE